MSFPLAVMDYGIGGIGLVSMIKEKYPGFPILYFSDSGEVPYGKLTYPILKRRVDKVISYLFAIGAQHVVVACHSASSVIHSNPHLTSIKELTSQSVLEYKLDSIGIIGGARTIRAGYYKRELKSLGISVKQRIAQQLSVLIERGDTDSTEIKLEVKRIVRPIQHVEGLLLACTHYPAIKSIIQEAINDNCKIIDPIEEIFHSLKDLISQTEARGDDLFLTSGKPDLMKTAAKTAFGFEIPHVKNVVL